MENEATYKTGDRVILHGLKTTAHVNGRHGVVSGLKTEDDRYPVDLDLWDPNAPGSIAVKPCNLIPEPELTPEKQSSRAGAHNGILDEEYGRPFSELLEYTRFLSAIYLCFDGDKVKTIYDINRLRRTPLGLLKLNNYMGKAWSHWFQGSSLTPDNKSMYELLHETMKAQALELRTEKEIAKIPEKDKKHLQFLVDVVDEPSAVAGWNVRIHGDFWIVSMDDDGTYLVPAENTKRVYQALGVLNAIYTSIVRQFPRPVLMTLTMIPYFGRLVYDGVCCPAGGVRTPRMASVGHTVELFQSVEEAKQNRLVVSRLLQLEVPGGSREGLQDSKSDAEAVNTPSSKNEKKLVKALKKISPYSMHDNNGFWVMRRFGYTKQDNPNNMIYAMSGGGSGMLGMFNVNKLEPTSVEILSETIKLARRYGNKRPCVLSIDEESCFQRVKFLLKDIKDTRVVYYMPPSKEETDAAMVAGGSMSSTSCVIS